MIDPHTDLEPTFLPPCFIESKRRQECMRHFKPVFKVSYHLVQGQPLMIWGSGSMKSRKNSEGPIPMKVI